MSNTATSNDNDAAVLAKMGYKQELRRNFSMLQVFGLAFSIMGPMPSIASTLNFSIPAGPAGMIWSWFCASCCIFTVGLAMSDLGSAMPTSGGLYWWTHHFASPKYRNFLSFLVGYSNTLGLIGSLCSVDYGFAKMVCSIVTIATDGAWRASEGITFLVFFLCVVTHATVSSTLSKIIGKLQSFSVAMNIIIILATLIALPIGRGKRGELDSAPNPLHLENLTTWPNGWAFMLAWISPIWSMAGFASCVNVSEEAANASKAVPQGMLLSIGNAWVFGFIIQIVLVASMSQDMSHYLNSPSGQPMAQIYYDAVGKNGTIGFMVLLCIVQFFMGLSVLVSVSRQSWAFSRDGALPFSKYMSRVAHSLGSVPFVAIWGCAGTASIIGLLSLADPAAANALFSMASAANNLAWAIPIMSRVVWGQQKFVPGPFHTGKYSQAIAWAAITFLAFSIILAMFPSSGPNPTAGSMNYTVVVNSAVWLGATAYYFLNARKWFTGPKTTASEGDGSADGAALCSPPSGDSGSSSATRDVCDEKKAARNSRFMTTEEERPDTAVQDNSSGDTLTRVTTCVAGATPPWSGDSTPVEPNERSQLPVDADDDKELFHRPLSAATVLREQPGSRNLTGGGGSEASWTGGDAQRSGPGWQPPSVETATPDEGVRPRSSYMG